MDPYSFLFIRLEAVEELLDTFFSSNINPSIDTYKPHISSILSILLSLLESI
jgi:hypothetical protein